MKWILVILVINIGHGKIEKEYDMPSFEDYMKAVAAVRFEKGARASDIVIAYCGTD